MNKSKNTAQPATYYPRPVAVEAMQVAKPYRAVADWAGATIIRERSGNKVGWLHLTVNGVAVRAHPGDWIVRNDAGQFKVVYKEHFERLYESADRLAELERAIERVRSEATELTDLPHDHFYDTATSPAEVGGNFLGLLPAKLGEEG